MMVGRLGRAAAGSSHVSQLLGVHLDAGLVTSSRLPREPGLRGLAGACPRETETRVGASLRGWGDCGRPGPRRHSCGRPGRGAHRAPAAASRAPSQPAPWEAPTELPRKGSGVPRAGAARGGHRPGREGGRKEGGIPHLRRQREAGSEHGGCAWGPARPGGGLRSGAEQVGPVGESGRLGGAGAAPSPGERGGRRSEAPSGRFRGAGPAAGQLQTGGRRGWACDASRRDKQAPAAATPGGQGLVAFCRPC